MSLILDTSFLIALSSVKDINHKGAESLKLRFRNKEFGQCYISDYIFDEFVTFLMAKSFPENSVREIGDALLADESIKLLRVDLNIFLGSWELFKRLSKLSFTDCTTAALAKEFGIKNIASFDSGFDKIAYLKRIQK